MCMLSCFSCVPLFATLWTVAHQAPLSLGFSRQEYWSGLPCSPLGVLLTQGSNLRHLNLLPCRWTLYPLSHPGALTLRVIIDKWELSAALLCFIFWLLYISVVSFFLCFHYFSLSFLWGFLFPLKDFCVWSIFIFCCFHEVCIKHLIDKIVVFLLKASYPHLHLSSSFMILLTQMTLFYIANFSFNLHAMLV